MRTFHEGLMKGFSDPYTKGGRYYAPNLLVTYYVAYRIIYRIFAKTIQLRLQPILSRLLARILPSSHSEFS
jgi:hypothetical protein